MILAQFVAVLGGTGALGGWFSKCQYIQACPYLYRRVGHTGTGSVLGGTVRYFVVLGQ